MQQNSYATRGSALQQVLPQPCPLCGKPVVPDTLGLLECACGWAGADDPLASARGVTRFVTRLDRRFAARAAREDLRKMAAGGANLSRIGPLYGGVLIVASTAIYLIVVAIAAWLAWSVVVWSVEGAWLGVFIAVVFLALIVVSLFEGRPRLKGVEATRDRFPQLFATLDEVSEQVRGPMPTRVVLLPHAEAFVYQHWPIRKFFRRELVLGLGAGALPLLSDVDLKAILAHEIAHFRLGHTALSRYCGGAEGVIRGLLATMFEAVGAQTGRNATARYHMGRRNYGGYVGQASLVVLLGTFIVWIVSLPLRLVVVGVHLLRLAESRAAEFDVDRAAVRAYGAQAFADGLTGIIVAGNTMRGAFSAIRDEMLRSGEVNFYAAMRRHYDQLPAQIIAKLRLDATREYRSLEQSHPTTPDRLRAAYLVGAPPSPAPSGPAVNVIVPAGEADAAAVELALTALLLTRTKGGRRRWWQRQ